MMKYKKHIIMPMLLAMLSVATSCEQEEQPPVVPEGDVVEVTATIGDAEPTRVSQPKDNVYTFDDNDKIHIVGWTGNWDGYNQPWNDPADTWWNDAVSTYNAKSEKWTTEPDMSWQNGDGLQHHFIAWWPEDFVESTDNFTNISIEITGDTEKDDILLARWSGTRPDDNTLRLEFNHLMARFDVHLWFRDEYTTHSDISIETNLSSKAECDFLAGNFTSLSGEGIEMQEMQYSGGNYHWSGTCITVPHEFSGPLLTIKFIGNGEEKTITYEHSAQLTFNSGQRITLYLIVGKDVVELGEVTETPWIQIDGTDNLETE